MYSVKMSASEIIPSLHTSNDFTTLAPANTSALCVPAGCVLRQFVKYIPWNNEGNIVPKRVEVIVRFVFNALVLPVLLLICVPTNITNMIVFYKQGLKERINTCLFALSLADLMFVVSAYGTDCDRIYMFLMGRGAEVDAAYIFFYRSNLIGFYGFVTVSQVVSSVIALERCLRVSASSSERSRHHENNSHILTVVDRVNCRRLHHCGETAVWRGVCL